MKKIISISFVLLLVLQIIGLFGLFLVWNNVSFSKSNSYQAVFLSSGQVFFGKITYSDSQYVQLTDIYYLQMPEALEKQDSEQNMVLIKRGNELHGPNDGMKINKSQILFIEEVKDSGKVAQAISDYKVKK
jgi:hypothetical protein